MYRIPTTELKKDGMVASEKKEADRYPLYAPLKKRGSEARRRLLDGDGLALQLLLLDFG
jgi:hypothetical protein